MNLNFVHALDNLLEVPFGMKSLPLRVEKMPEMAPFRAPKMRDI